MNAISVVNKCKHKGAEKRTIFWINARRPAQWAAANQTASINNERAINFAIWTRAAKWIAHAHVPPTT